MKGTTRPPLEGGLMVNLGGYRFTDLMKITGKNAEWNATGRKQGDKTWGEEIY